MVEAAGLPKLHTCPEDSRHVRHWSEESSIMPLIRNSNAPWKSAVFSQYPRPTHRQKAMGYTITTIDYRYTEWARATHDPVIKPDWNTIYQVELYDHTKDPEENYNVADESHYVHIRNRLSKELRSGWRAKLHSDTQGIATIVG